MADHQVPENTPDKPEEVSAPAAAASTDRVTEPSASRSIQERLEELERQRAQLLRQERLEELERQRKQLLEEARLEEERQAAAKPAPPAKPAPATPPPAASASIETPAPPAPPATPPPATPAVSASPVTPPPAPPPATPVASASIETPAPPVPAAPAPPVTPAPSASIETPAPPPATPAASAPPVAPAASASTVAVEEEEQPMAVAPSSAALPLTPDEEENLAHLLHERPSWIKQFVDNIHDLIKPPKIEMPEGLTSKPLDASDEFSSHLLREAPPWHKQFIQNVTEFFHPPKVEPLEGITSKPAEGGDELSSHLLREAPPWHKQFLQNLKELVKPEKLAPLEGITSKPIEVKKESGLYAGNEWKAGLMSATINIGVILLLLFVGTSDVVQQKVKETVTLIAPNLRPPPPPSAPAKQMAGGGGGGNHSPIEASKGKLPKQAPKVFTPPRVDRLEDPKLPMTPTIAPTGPVPDIKADNFGDPLAGIGIPSNGTGLGGSIGEGKGPGVGPGSGGGFGGGAYRIGGGVSAPTVIYQVEPEYSEEARKAKYAGKVMLSIVVDEEGLPQNIRVVRKLGLGLDEKAIEAVQKWRFNPGMKDGKPVPVQATIEVTFRLL